ncbi:MAG: hypothetical protein Q8L66_11345 [Caulobacter sp.]|nr:hypothetical protein [Caulobacter sp.]
MSQDWPQNDWFSPADTNYLAAIGAMTIRYARLEEAHQGLANFYLGSLPDGLRFQILQPMTNAERSAVLRAAADAVESSEAVKEAIFYFLRAFSICTENRSIAAHAAGMPGTTHVHLTKRTAGPPYRQNRYAVTVSDLRHAADSTLAFVDYGKRLHRFLSTRVIHDARKEENWLVGPRPLPDRPAQPRKLAPYPPEEVHPDDPIPF